jgi:hypothetical protein
MAHRLYLISNASKFAGSAHAFQRVLILSGLSLFRYTGQQVDDNAQEGKDDPCKDYRPPDKEYDDSENWYGRSGARTPDRPVGIAPNQEAPQDGDHQAGQHCF